MRRPAAALLLFLGLWLSGASGQQPQGDAPSIAGELIVKFRADASQSRRDAALAGRGARLLRRFEALDLHHVRVPEGQNLQAAIAALQADPDVVFAQPNYIRRTTQAATPNDPSWLNNSLWGLKQIRADTAWSSFTTGDGSVVVADIDTGVNYLHPDLAANMWRNPGEIPANGVDDDGNGYVDDVHGINVITHTGDPMDDHGHGTHTAGTIAGVGNNGLGVVGVIWNAKIVACKFMSAAGTGSDAGAIECFNYIVGLKTRGVNIRASNNSWGAPRTGFPDAMMAAIDAAGAAGILNVCAAGNDGRSNDVRPFDPASLPSSRIVSVAASDGSDNRAGFSNYGTAVHLAAPGVSIVSTYGMNYATLDGTSMAAPHVTGAALIIAQRNPNLSPEGIRTLLMSSVDVLPQWTGLVASGGRLNLFGAAAAAVQTSSPQSLFTTQVPVLGDYSDGATYELGMRFEERRGRSDYGDSVLEDPDRNRDPRRANLDDRRHVTGVDHVYGRDRVGVAAAGVDNTAGDCGQHRVYRERADGVQRPSGCDREPAGSGPEQRRVARAGRELRRVRQPVGSFPAFADSTAYFRDIVFVPNSSGPDTTPPTVSITQPAQGSTVIGSITISATASDDVAVAGVQFQVDGVNLGGEVTSAPYSVVWNSTAVGNGNHTLTAIARDAAGHMTPASVAVTVNNGAIPPSQGLFTTQVPVVSDYADGSTYELGMRFVSDVTGQITAIRFWKTPTETGTHVGRIWSAGGALLVSTTFTGETASGWQQQALTTPLAIAANTEYVVSVPTGSNGRSGCDREPAGSRPEQRTVARAGRKLRPLRPTGGEFPGVRRFDRVLPRHRLRAQQ